MTVEKHRRNGIILSSIWAFHGCSSFPSTFDSQLPLKIQAWSQTYCFASKDCLQIFAGASAGLTYKVHAGWQAHFMFNSGHMQESSHLRGYGRHELGSKCGQPLDYTKCQTNELGRRSVSSCYVQQTFNMLGDRGLFAVLSPQLSIAGNYHLALIGTSC